jgi:predicted porin
MRRNLAVLAIAASLAGVACAQSSVTLYGSFDGGIRNQTNAGAARAATHGTRLGMGSSGTYNSNRIGFKGAEDLGDGMNAHFDLETGFNTGTGALNNTLGQLFDRSAYVGVGGSLGTVDLGRQYSVAFKVVAAYDPLGYKYTSIAPVAVWSAGSQGTGANPFGYGSTRFNNDIQYSKVWGPLIAYAEYALGEVAGSSANGRAAAVGATYVEGPLGLGAAYTSRKTDGILHAAGAPFANTINLAATSATPFDKTNTQWTIGGAYRIGAVRLAAGYLNEKQDLRTGVTLRTRDAWGGVRYAITPALEVTGAYYRTSASAPALDGRRDFYIVSGTYALSKRTNLYAEVDHNRYKDGAVAFYAPLGAEKQVGISVGINHYF